MSARTNAKSNTERQTPPQTSDPISDPRPPVEAFCSDPRPQTPAISEQPSGQIFILIGTILLSYSDQKKLTIPSKFDCVKLRFKDFISDGLDHAKLTLLWIKQVDCLIF